MKRQGGTGMTIEELNRQIEWIIPEKEGECEDRDRQSEKGMRLV